MGRKFSIQGLSFLITVTFLTTAQGMDRQVGCCSFPSTVACCEQDDIVQTESVRWRERDARAERIREMWRKKDDGKRDVLPDCGKM